MSIVFWLIASILMGVACLFVVPPLWTKKTIIESDEEQQNIEIARQRAKELKAQLQAEVIAQDQYDEQFTELELALNDDLSIANTAVEQQAQGRWISFVILFGLPVIAVALYIAFGNQQALQKDASAPAAQQQFTADDIKAMVAGLAARLEQQPDDAQGWLMLGRSYKHLKQFDKAVPAFAKAYELLGDEPEVMLQYADSLAMENGGRVTGKAAELVYKVLEIMPNSATALWLAGMAKAELGEFKGAIAYWRQLETLLPAGSESLHEVQTLIAQVEAQNPGSVAAEQQSEVKEAVAPAVAAAVPSKVAIEVSVSLSSEFAALVKAMDTVFIYAQALTGPQMPLAIVRKQVSDLPLTITLSDAQAMAPAFKLSAFKKVKLIARISKSGNAIKQPGDFIGIVEPISVGEINKVLITIDSRV
jgi:cytochrome c-type biogenesis protein CcmH